MSKSVVTCLLYSVSTALRRRLKVARSCDGGKIFSIAIPLVMTLAMLLAFETGLRLMGCKPAGAAHFSMKFFAPDPIIGFRAYKHARWYFDTTPHGETAQRIFGTTNALGYRPTIQNAECHDCPYIVTLGDSITFGAESPDNSTFPEYITRALHRRGKDYKALNMSFSGWSTLQEALILKEINTNNKKIDYIIYTVVPNDIIENIMSLSNLPVPLVKYEDGHITIKPPVFDNKFQKMSLMWHIEEIIRRFALTTLIWRWSGRQLIGEYDPLPKIPTDAPAYRLFWSNGALVKVQDMLKLTFADTAEAHLAQQAFAYALRDMAETSKNMGAKLLVVPCQFGAFSDAKNGEEFRDLVPLSFSEYTSFMEAWHRYNAAMKNITLNNGIAYLDLGANVFEGMSYRDYTAVHNDWHFSVAANEKFGTKVAEQILTLNK